MSNTNHGSNGSNGSNGGGGTATATGPSPVLFPADPVDPAGTDLAGPVTALLEQVRVLETDADMSAGVSARTGTPDSLQVITAGVLSTTKVVSAVTAGGGLAATIGSLVAAFQASELPLRISLIAAAGVILAATVLALAVIVSADVSGRAAATVAQYDARARITSSALGMYAPVSGGSLTDGADVGARTDTAALIAALLASMTAFPTAVVTNNGDVSEVNGIRFGDEGLQVRRVDGDWIGIDRVRRFQTA